MREKMNFGFGIFWVLVGAVLFTPLSVPFGLQMLPLRLYLESLGLILVPLVVMEIGKAVAARQD